MRIDDLDSHRNDPAAVGHILQTLDNFGLHWDGEVMYESHHITDYQQALECLQEKQLIFSCLCSRKQLMRYRKQYPEATAYSGLCRKQQYDNQLQHTLRIKTFSETIRFVDLLQGEIKQNLQQKCGDFIVKRRDQIISYQLSTVVSEQLQQISEVVRGFDLIDSTPRQIYLQRQLSLHTPNYMHVPVIIDDKGIKLSKQTFAPAVTSKNISQTLIDLLIKLKQFPPQQLVLASPTEIINWAIAHWNPKALRNFKAIGL